MTLPVVRFAPSPTGYLHVGNARVALLNWLFARARGGRFILRLDDTDKARCRPEYAEAIERDLAWLGLDWDLLARQSERLERYEAAARALKEAGRLYACFETPEELEYKRRRQRARGRPPVYDRAGLKLDAAARAALEAEGRRPHWRFLLDAGEERWDDLVRGPCSYDAAHLSDPVLVREDGTFLYTLPSVVDDLDMGVTHVVRGEDHVTNTAVQIQLARALAPVVVGESAPAAVPCFAHAPLLVGADGAGLSKREGSLSLHDLAREGIEPEALAALLARLGTGEGGDPPTRIAALAEGFDLTRFGRAAARFDRRELDGLNARLLHAMPFEVARPRLEAHGLAGVDETFWHAVRPNLARLADARDWWRVCRAPVSPVRAAEDADFLDQAADLLPAEPWDDRTWGLWTKALGQASGRKGKALFRPLRLALTGLEHGPELKNLLPLVGRDRAVARLRGETA